MNKNIFAGEWRKLYRMPVFYLLLVFCLGLNIFFIWDSVGHKLDAINEEAVWVGEDSTGYAAYWYDAHDCDPDYKQVQTLAQREQEFSGFAQSLISTNFDKLAARAEAMTATERDSVTFAGAFKLHAYLFEGLFLLLTLECMGIVFLSAAYLLHFEGYYHTEDLVLTTLTGPKTYLVKILAAGMFSLILCIMLVSVTLGIWFALLDYSHIWDSFVSSIFNADRRTINDWYLHYYPYVTWKPMTVAAYLLRCLAVTVLLCLAVWLLVSAGALMIRQSFLLLAVTGVSVFGLYALGNLIQVPNLLDFVLKCNPIHLTLKSGYWFMDYAAGDSYPGYEWLTCAMWILIGGASLATVLKRLISRNFEQNQ